MKKTAILFGAACVPFAALAAPAAPSYTYVQGDYAPYGKIDNADADYDGFGLEGSIELAPHVYTKGRYDRFDVNGSPTDIDRGSLGVGLHQFLEYGDDMGVGYYGQVSYERLEFDDVLGGADTSANGYGIDLGLRWLAAPGVEINPNVGYVDYATNSGDGVSLGKADGMRYSLRTLGYLTDNVALSAEYAHTDYDISAANFDLGNEVKVGARYSF